MSAPRKVAFVSGKGGVGKTLLASNFAFCASTSQRTLLVDFDFQNQGSSGLLADYLEPGCLNAFDILNQGSVDAREPIKIRDQLHFIPSFDPRKSDRFSSQLSSVGALDIGRFDRILDHFLASGEFELVIADCHGGLDDVSFAAFISSDLTFIVTEPDKVTFSGTLELLDFYVSRAAVLRESAASAQQPAGSPPMPEKVVGRVVRIENNKVRILVNRVSGKFTYRALLHIYARQFYVNIAALQEMNQGFSFFPADPLVAESFSEYPFYVELMPESVFSQKVELLYTQIFGRPPDIRGRSRFYRITERIPPAKLERSIKSPYEARVQAVFSFVAVSQLVFFSMSALLLSMVDIIANNQHVSSFTLRSVGIAVSIFFLYLFRFNLLIAGFFRDRLRYELRLYKKGARALSVPFTMRLIRIFLFRVFPVLGGITFLMLSIVFGLSALLG